MKIVESLGSQWANRRVECGTHPIEKHLHAGQLLGDRSSLRVKLASWPVRQIRREGSRRMRRAENRYAAAGKRLPGRDVTAVRRVNGVVVSQSAADDVVARPGVSGARRPRRCPAQTQVVHLHQLLPGALEESRGADARGQRRQQDRLRLLGTGECVLTILGAQRASSVFLACIWSNVFALHQLQLFTFTFSQFL